MNTPVQRCITPLMVALALACASALAQTDAHAKEDRATSTSATERGARPTVEQKRAMVERLLLDSPAASRINQSTNAEARRHLNLARDMYEGARALIAEGRSSAAEAMLNEAIWQIGQARQLVPDPLARLVEERMRYNQLQESIAALRASYAANVERQRARGRGNVRELEDIAGLTEAARILGEGERIGEANRLLDQALTSLLRQFERELGGRAVVYSRSFARPEDEYTFELERNRSYETLIPIAVTEFRPGSEVVAQIEAHVAQNRTLRARAEREALSRNLKAAVQALQSGTDALQRALQAAGLNVPQTID